MKNEKDCLLCLKNHLDAENRHDLEAIMATYGKSPVVNINGQPFEGIEAVRFFHDRFGFGGSGAFSDVYVREKKRRICENAVVIEQELSGIHTGKWQGKEATGKLFTMPVCTIYSFDSSGKLIREDVYFDSTIMLRQLGLMK